MQVPQESKPASEDRDEEQLYSSSVSQSWHSLKKAHTTVIMSKSLQGDKYLKAHV